jgi:beta-glucanase (GH16 family)
MRVTKWCLSVGGIVAAVAGFATHSAGQDAGNASAAAAAIAKNQSPPVRAASAAPPAETTADGYRLVWHDEFNKDGPLNPADWGYELGFVRNQELQWYQPENAVCKDGCLMIEARKESKPNPRYVAPDASGGTDQGGRGGGRRWQNRPTIEVTSASVTTRGKHSWLYGRFEIRAKIDTRSGSWPAFWMLGTQGRWPACGEVDIMEYFGNNVLANIAWAGKPGGAPNPNGATWNSARLPLRTLPANWSDQFHAWRMDWDPTSIKLYLDDKQVNEQDLSKTINTSRGRGAPENPFVEGGAYIILNQAIGGQAGGDPSHTEFPVRFLVDYVRVWQKPAAATSADNTSRAPPVSKE